MRNKRDKILILFEGFWLAYSPTLIQLYEELHKKYDITILAERPIGQELSLTHTYYFKYKKGYKRYGYKLLFIFLSLFMPLLKNFNIPNCSYQDYFFRFLFIKRLLRRNSYRRIICVDIKNLMFCSLLKENCDFLSLEIGRNENLLSLIDTGIIDRVIIQREDRYKYLFKNIELPTYLVQNAPSYRETEKTVNKNGLIFLGSLIKEFGIFYYLDYLLEFKTEKLVMAGRGMTEATEKQINEKYAELIKSKRLIIETKYLKNEDVVSFISAFEIGFCLYDFNAEFIKSYNFQTAPAGKVFKYLAAGVPVICNDIPGFDFVNSFQCGELLTDMSPQSIANAIIRIRENYSIYEINCKKAASHFSFDKAIQPYLNYIDNQ